MTVLYGFVLSLKRAVRSIYVPAFLIVMAVTVSLAPMLGREESLPCAGVCDLDNSEQSVRVHTYLVKNGFVLCDDEQELRKRISKGEYDCGVIIPQGFGAQMKAAELEESLIFIDSPLSYSPELYKNHIGAAVFGEVAPYISSGVLENTEIPPERMLEKYREMSADGTSFSLILETADSTLVTDNGRARTYALGAASLFIFAFIMYAACDVLNCDIGVMSHRIGMKKTVLFTVIPDMTVRVIGVWVSMLIAATVLRVLAGDGVLLSLIPSVFIYTVLLAAFGLMLVALLSDAGRIQIFTFFMLVMALALCPIYIDLALYASWLDVFRCILPTYWLWMCADKPIVMSVITAVAVPSALGMLYARFAKKTNV